MRADKEYIIRIRRELHQIPELRYDLPKTLALIRRELDAMGVPYTEQYGTSSIIATLNEGVGNKTIAIRADTDALPIQEETGLPFSSTHPGQMHACGHDCHTAMLLGAVKLMSENADKIHCCVKFVFQACEEGPSGAKRICNDGFMDTVDMIIGCHINPDKPAGSVLINKTCSNAGSHGFTIHLEGKPCHVARPHQGIDAIAMAVRVYSDIQIMRARELDPLEPIVIGIGEFHSGTAKNIVSGSATMSGTIRTLCDETDKNVWARIEQIAKTVAEDMGGSASMEDLGYNPALINESNLINAIEESAIKVVGKDMVLPKPTSMGAEDFSHYTYRKPGAMFCLGVMPADGNYIPLHNSKMMVNEDVLDVTANVFTQFVLDQMDK